MHIICIRVRRSVGADRGTEARNWSARSNQKKEKKKKKESRKNSDAYKDDANGSTLSR